MWLLFDIGNPRILNAAPHPDQLRFEEEELPPYLAAVRHSRIESIEDPLFLYSKTHWPEINLRRLYVFLNLKPPLGPTKMDDATVVAIRYQIRNAIATTLGLEPNRLPALESPDVKFVVTPAPPRPSKQPIAKRGSVGPLIHRVATEMWEAAGNPKDIPILLQLRQTIMKVLQDEHSVKLATSSNELGRWQKNLLAPKTDL
jgi:hypothetical protein